MLLPHPSVLLRAHRARSIRFVAVNPIIPRRINFVHVDRLHTGSATLRLGQNVWNIANRGPRPVLLDEACGLLDMAARVSLSTIPWKGPHG